MHESRVKMRKSSKDIFISELDGVVEFFGLPIFIMMKIKLLHTGDCVEISPERVPDILHH